MPILSVFIAFGKDDSTIFIPTRYYELSSLGLNNIFKLYIKITSIKLKKLNVRYIIQKVN